MRKWTKVLATTYVASLFLISTPLVTYANPPPEKGINGLRKILDGIIDGQTLSSNWCLKQKILSMEIFSPRSYRIIGDPREDMVSKEGEYFNGIKVRIESSNKSGMPIIKDWYFLIRYAEKTTGSTEWCVSSLL